MAKQKTLAAQPLRIQAEVRTLAKRDFEALEGGIHASARRTGALDQGSHRRVGVGVGRQRVALYGRERRLGTRLLRGSRAEARWAYARQKSGEKEQRCTRHGRSGHTWYPNPHHLEHLTDVDSRSLVTPLGPG